MIRTEKRGRVEKLGRPTDPGLPKDERGFVVVIVIIIIAALALLGLAANRNLLTDIGIAQNHGGNTRGFYAAEAGAEYAYNQLTQLLGQATTVPAGGIDYGITAAMPTIAGCTINSAKVLPPSAAPGDQRTITASSGPTARYKGLYSWVQTYTILAAATDNSTGAKTTLMLDVTANLIPIFQFGIFYQNDLEMNPGANLNIPVNGWIHTNKNLYTSTSATETINSHITVAGGLRHGRDYPNDNSAVGTGNVQIMGTDGNLHNLGNGSQTLSGSTWVNNSSWNNTASQWGGTVASQEQGVQALTLPLPTEAANNPEYVVNQGGTMNTLAAVVITDYTAKNAAGGALNTCYANSNHKNSNGTLKTDPGCSGTTNQNSITRSSATQSSVYDYREGKTAQTVDIDLAKFQTTDAGQYLAATTPSAGGTAGVLYATSTQGTSSSTFNALRLVNGSILNSPFTVATDLPAYVQGDYNKGDSSHPAQPASIMSDATTVLSNQWSNTYSSSTSLTGTSGRNVTSALTINADIMTGNSATTSTNGYGGGFENFIRFLENWSGQSYNFGGSLVCMWQSQKATGKWITPGTYYNAPNRQYTFGVFGTNWPPGTPKVVITTKGTWRQQ